jgi:hypothetical protein
MHIPFSVDLLYYCKYKVDDKGVDDDSYELRNQLHANLIRILRCHVRAQRYHVAYSPVQSIQV